MTEERRKRGLRDRIEDAVEALLGSDEDEDEDRDRDEVGRGKPGKGEPTGRGGSAGPASRPGKTVGTSRGTIDGTPITMGDLKTHHHGTSWPGERKDMPIPLLFLRCKPGDNGTRPVVGSFWESPDIHILAGVAPGVAPDIPTKLGETAIAEQPNTIYAHIWNFGRGAAREVVVDFAWMDPSLGVNPAGIKMIGQAGTSLGARGSGEAHRVVKCPDAWYATYKNGGHECLLVRAWTPVDDVLGTPDWDASLNRHVGQRNIHVIQADELQSAPPLLLHVGPLYGAPAQVSVARADPTTMPWLQLHTGVRGQFPAAAVPTGQPVLTPPGGLGGAPGPGVPGQVHTVQGDNQQVGFTTTDGPPGTDQAHVYRVTANQDGQVVGGYTVVVVG
jgi:hypothetical protein